MAATTTIDPPPTSATSTDDTDTPAAISVDTDTGLRRGRTPTGQTFSIPRTDSMFRTLLSPTRYGPAELLTLFCLFLQVLSLLFVRYLPTLFYILQFAFWRLAYNVGLGLILRAQSNHSAITTFVTRLDAKHRALLHAVSAHAPPPPYKWEHAPAAFNAWVIFRSLATLILANDGASFMIAAIACFRPVTTLSEAALFLPCAILAVPVAAVGVWAKHEAHETLSDYAWFWGDFFFSRLGDTFTSTGVFALFPHPMYTVGYSPYYAAILLTRSPHLATAAILAHTLQILFLFFIEEPHMHKLYGSPSTTPPKSTSPFTSHDSSDFPSAANGDSVNDAPSRVGDVDVNSDNAAMRLFEQASPHPIVLLTIAISTLPPLLLFSQAAPSPFLTIPTTLALRLLHWLSLSTLLPRPTKHTDNLWVRTLHARHASHSRIFSAWQHVLAVSTICNHAVFLACALSIGGGLRGFLPGVSAMGVACFVWGWVMVGGGVLASVWALRSVGGFAWYYGDFFVEGRGRMPVYEGIFAYVGHPEAVFSYVAYFGVAVMARSWVLAGVAALCQACHVAFVWCVEEPHMREEYALVRARAPAIEKLLVVAGVRQALRVFGEVVGKGVAVVAARVGGGGGEGVRRAVEVRVERVWADGKKMRVRGVDRVEGIWRQVVKMVQSFDWGIVAAKMRMVGFKVEAVGPSLDQEGGRTSVS